MFFNYQTAKSQADPFSVNNHSMIARPVLSALKSVDMRSEFYITPISIPLMIKSLLYDLDGNWFLTCDKHMRSKKNIICYYSDICSEGRHIH